MTYKKGDTLKGPDGATYTIGQRGRKPLWVDKLLGVSKKPKKTKATKATKVAQPVAVTVPQKGELVIGPNGEEYRVGQKGKVPKWFHERFDQPNLAVVGKLAFPLGELSTLGKEDMDRKLEGLQWYEKEGRKLDKDTSITNCSFSINGTPGFVGEDVYTIVPKGSVLRIEVDYSKVTQSI